MPLLTSLYHGLGYIAGIPVFTLIFLGLASLLMVFSRYGHLKNKRQHIILAIIASWCLAFPAFALHVPANRLSFQDLSLAQLKLLQEGMALLLFLWFAHSYLNEPLHPRQIIGVGIVLSGIWMVFGGF